MKNLPNKAGGLFLSEVPVRERVGVFHLVGCTICTECTPATGQLIEKVLLEETGGI